MATEQRKDEAPWERLVRENRPTYPEFARLAAERGWDEEDDRWLEAVTGEPVPRDEDEPRDSHL